MSQRRTAQDNDGAGKDAPLVYMKCDCEHCGGGIEFPEHGAGQEIPCPHCSEQIALPVKPTELGEPQRPGQPDDEDGLNAILAAQEAKQGPPDLILAGGCPSCGQEIISKHWGNLGEVEFSDFCEKCGLSFLLIPDRPISSFCCPQCKNLISGSATICSSCSTRLLPRMCPGCSSQELLVVSPDKPGIFVPLSFTGILLGAASSAIADTIFNDFYRCQTCGREWE